MAEKALVSVTRFGGLHTSLDQEHIGDNELSVAENVCWDNDGIIRNRLGVSVQGYAPGDFADRSAKVGYPTELKTAWEDVYFGGVIYAPNTLTAKSDTVAPRLILLCGIGGNDPLLSVFGDRINTQTSFEQITNAANVSQIPGIVYNLGGTQWLYLSDGIKLKWDSHFGSPGFTWPAPVNVRVGAFVLHKDRIFMADKWNLITNRLYFSAPGDPENWAAPDGGFFDIGNEDGGRITCAVSYQDALYIFKTGSLWVLHTPGSPSNWTLRKISELGCWGQTAVSHQGAIYFAGPDGVYRWLGNSGTKLSGPIQNLLSPSSELFSLDSPADGNWGASPVSGDSWSLTHGQKASPRACAYRDSYYLLTMTHGGEVMLLEYNIKVNAWSRHTISGYDMNDALDIYSIPDDLTGLKYDANTAQPGVYISFQSTTSKNIRVVKFTNNLWVDRGIDSQGVTNPNGSDNVISVSTQLTHSVAGYRFICGLDNRDHKILSNTLGIGSQVTLYPDDFISGIDVTATNYAIYGSQPYTTRIKTRLFNFGDPFSFKRIKGLVLQVIYRKMKVSIISNDDAKVINLKELNPHSDLRDTQFLGGKDTYRTVTIPGGLREQNVAVQIEVVNDYDPADDPDADLNQPEVSEQRLFHLKGDWKLFGLSIFGKNKSSVGEATAHAETARS